VLLCAYCAEQDMHKFTEPYLANLAACHPLQNDGRMSSVHLLMCFGLSTLACI